MFRVGDENIRHCSLIAGLVVGDGGMLRYVSFAINENCSIVARVGTLPDLPGDS